MKRGFGYTKCGWHKCGKKRVLKKRRDQRFCSPECRRDYWTNEMRKLRMMLKEAFE